MIEAIILGAIQGLGEFLPISSSAHLVILPWLFGWDKPGIGFDVALHIGTLLALILYFKADLWLMVTGFWNSLWPKTRNLRDNIYQKLPWLLILGTIPGALAGAILQSKIEVYFHKPAIVAVTLAVVGVILFLADKYGKKNKNLNDLTWIYAFIIGCSQALALVPGVSRSGATITAALILGMARPDAARFSFLLSVPIILGAGILELPHFTDGVGLPALLLGMATATLTGYFAIKYMLRYIAKNGFGIFVIYRIIFALIIAMVIFVRG